MSAKYPYYLLADSPEDRWKEAEIIGQAPPDGPSEGDIRKGVPYRDRVSCRSDLSSISVCVRLNQES
jgi:adenine-specific DNA-methyltransferase